MNELALFAGAGGGILGGKLLGWRTICAVELDSFCARRLMQRQNEGHISPFPIWDDVCTFDGRPWRGIVDVVSGGFPCQDISPAGKRAGINGARSGLWAEMARIISEVRPWKVFIENSHHLPKHALAGVLSDLAFLGFDAQWGIVRASYVGAPHDRARCWIVADASRKRIAARLPDKPGVFRQAQKCEAWRQIGAIPLLGWQGGFGALSDIPRMDDGLANRLDRLRVVGNGQVPAVAATAWEILNAEKSAIENKKAIV